jgi:hypothetical protein
MLATSVENVEAFSMKSRHPIQKVWRAKLKAAVQFGSEQARPRRFRDRAATAWRKSVSVKGKGLDGVLTPSLF